MSTRHIAFTLPTDFSDAHIEGVQALNERFAPRGTKVVELFGALPVSPVGSARDPCCVPPVSKKKLAQHVASCKESGLELNYLLNAACLGNEEFTKEGRRKLLDFLSFLSDAGVERVTVAIPYLGELIRERFPHFQLTASVIAYIDAVDKARFFESLGFNRITLDWDQNRNFKLIAAMRAGLKVEMEVLTNSSCILQCPMKSYHYNLESHRSREPVGDFWPINPCKQKCMQMLLEEPFRFLTSPFIRPEDVPRYAEYGITHFKIAGREYRSPVLLKMAEHYLNLHYEGNIFALLGAFMEPTEARRPLSLYLENRALDGFLDFFEKAYPCPLGCARCMYCARYLEALTVSDATAQAKVAYAKERQASLTMEEAPSPSISQKLLALQNQILRRILYKKSGMIP